MEITNSDKWSAIRGLSMGRMDYHELINLRDFHKGRDAFASQVIAAAAHELLAVKQVTWSAE